MNTAVIPTVPTDADQYDEISTNMDDWQTAFLNLIRQKRRIRYGRYTMPRIPDEIKDELSKSGYRDITVMGDHWQHYLVPS